MALNKFRMITTNRGERGRLFFFYLSERLRLVCRNKEKKKKTKSQSCHPICFSKLIFFHLPPSILTSVENVMLRLILILVYILCNILS